MRVQLLRWSGDAGWQRARRRSSVGRIALDDGSPADGHGAAAKLPAGQRAQLALVFGARGWLQDGACLRALAAELPEALLAGCSTSGDICGTLVSDDGPVAAVVTLERGGFALGSSMIECNDPACCATCSAAATATALCQLPPDGLHHVLLFAEGVHINGSEVARAAVAAAPPGVTVSGGLAGDGEAFAQTVTVAGTEARPRQIVAIGIYGAAVRVGWGSMGGWDPFGPERLVTGAQGNIVHSLDDEPALALYRRYLGPLAAALPSSGLLFPLMIRSGPHAGLVRTILGLDEASGSLTFAGDVPAGVTVQMMKANFDRLIEGAGGAADTAVLPRPATQPALALLVSCVGRRAILHQRVEEEVEAVVAALGQPLAPIGFYSYGEIAPTGLLGSCELHNQTMTVTTLTEDV